METKMIHPTAILSPGAKIADDVEIGAYSIIGEDVTIGKGTWIGPHVVIDPHVTIGPGCRIFQYAAIGAIPQDLKFGGGKKLRKNRAGRYHQGICHDPPGNGNGGVVLLKWVKNPF